MAKKKGCGCFIGGFGVGSVLAMILSFMKWNSILWTLFHGCLGWIYVIYYVIFL